MFIKQFKIDNKVFMIKFFANDLFISEERSKGESKPKKENESGYWQHRLEIYLVIGSVKIKIHEAKGVDIDSLIKKAQEYCEIYSKEGELINGYSKLLDSGYKPILV